MPYRLVLAAAAFVLDPFDPHRSQAADQLTTVERSDSVRIWCNLGAHVVVSTYPRKRGSQREVR